MRCFSLPVQTLRLSKRFRLAQRVHHVHHPRRVLGAFMVKMLWDRLLRAFTRVSATRRFSWVEDQKNQQNRSIFFKGHGNSTSVCFTWSMKQYDTVLSFVESSEIQVRLTYNSTTLLSLKSWVRTWFEPWRFAGMKTSWDSVGSLIYTCLSVRSKNQPQSIQTASCKFGHGKIQLLQLNSDWSYPQLISLSLLDTHPKN